jgi:hypothetical protein
MWIFTRYGFVSVACAKKRDGSIDEDTVMVRARARKHLENLRERFPDTVFGKSEILAGAGTDYKFRIVLSKSEWASIVSQLVMEQTWSNFKSEATRFAKLKTSGLYIHALHEIWAIMLDFQSDVRRAKGEE